MSCCSRPRTLFNVFPSPYHDIPARNAMIVDHASPSNGAIPAPAVHYLSLRASAPATPGTFALRTLPLTRLTARGETLVWYVIRILRVRKEIMPCCIRAPRPLRRLVVGLPRPLSENCKQTPATPGIVVHVALSSGTVPAPAVDDVRASAPATAQTRWMRILPQVRLAERGTLFRCDIRTSSNPNIMLSPRHLTGSPFQVKPNNYQVIRYCCSRFTPSSGALPAPGVDDA